MHQVAYINWFGHKIYRTIIGINLKNSARQQKKGHLARD
jgi:hypothetical protein